MENRGAAAVETGEAPTSGLGFVLGRERLGDLREAAVDTRELPTSRGEVAMNAEGDAPTRSTAVLESVRRAPTSGRELLMTGETNASSTGISSYDSSQDLDDLSIDLGVLEMREEVPRMEVIRLIRSLRMDIRRFQQNIPMEVSKQMFRMQSANDEQGKHKEKIGETEDLCFVQNLVQETRNIESYIDEVDQAYKERHVEEDEVLMHLTDIQGCKVMMNCLLRNMKKFHDHQWPKSEMDYEEALPPLPHFEVNQAQRKTKSEDSSSSSDSDSSSSACSEVELLQDMYSLEGPYWQALSAPTKILATDDEEEAMTMDASIPLGSDSVAVNMITMFDESGRSTNELGHKVGTCREFLLNLPLIYVCNNSKCSICRTGFLLKDRCARLPCKHSFHVRCILEWLLKKTTCPMCRQELPRR